MNDRENVLLEKSMSFAVRIVNLCKFLRQQMHETVLSSQVLRSGTSIGANAHEANSAQSKADFVSKCSIALKECDETGYGLELLKRTDYLSGDHYRSLDNDRSELFALLTAIIKKSKLTM